MMGTNNTSPLLFRINNMYYNEVIGGLFMAKNEIDFSMGKNPQHKNGKINPKSESYDKDLANRRRKEKQRRKANQLKRK